MQSTIVISPEKTEITAIREKFEPIPWIQIIPSGAEIENTPKAILLDFTFDYFQKTNNPAYFYRLFSELQSVLDKVQLKKTKIYVMKNYPFSTSYRDKLMLEKIVSQFIHLLIEYYDAHLILLPDLISRYTFEQIKHPAIELLNKAMLGKSVKVPVNERSRVCILYALDFMHVLIENLEKGIDSHLVIEGHELTLKSLHESSQEVFGVSPARFDKENFIQYHYPNMNGVAISHINYGIGSMMVDLENRRY